MNKEQAMDQQVYYEIYRDLMKIPFYQSKQGVAMNTAEALYNLGYRLIKPESLTVLSDEKIKATRHYNPTTNGCYKTDERAVAQAQLSHTLEELKG